MIQLSNLSFSYSQKIVLQNINLEIKEGEFICIIGSCGCGKTTLLKIMAGLLVNYSGQVLINNKIPSEFRKHRKYAYFFQETNLFPWRTVEKNIKLPLEIKGDNKKRIDDILNLMNLQKYRDFYPHQISGGMKQKTALARGLVFDPEILFMDEPFVNLDEITREEMEEELLRIWTEKKQTILFVTHSITEAVFLSDKIAVLSSKGKLKKIMKINLEKPRIKDIRKTNNFFFLTNRLRKILRE